jgi:hypothetical protein
MSTHGHTKRISPHAQTRGGERRAGCMPGTGYRIRTLQSYKPWFSWWNTQRIYRFRCEQRQPPYPAPFPARYDACQYQNRQCLARFRPSAQVALGWLLQKAPWIVPIPGTTKLSHLEENLRTFDFNLSSKEWHELENAVAAIPVMGDRYNAEQQRQVGR